MTAAAASEGEAARRYLRRHRAGVLSTLSERLGGYPFGSVVPFVLDHAARPVILVSRLAEHTKNLVADPRASLLVQDRAEDVQTAARLTLAGDAVPVADRALRHRYLRHFPDAQRLLDLGDFTFFALQPAFVRHILGFGVIRSITPQAYAPPEHGLAEAEPEIVAHMNDDHADALRAYWRTTGAGEAANVQMIGVDCDGFDLHADGRHVRCDFPVVVTNAGKAREALVEMARAARAS